MWAIDPVSFIIITLSLALAFQTNTRYFVLFVMRKTLELTGLKWFGNSIRSSKFEGIIEVIAAEKRRRAEIYGYRKWEYLV